MMLALSATASFLLLHISLVLGHGAIETEAEAAFRMAHIARSKRSLDACSHKMTKRDVVEKRLSRTDAFLGDHRHSLGLAYDIEMIRRDFIVNGANSSCVLTPESEEGPFYIAGMLIRRDIRETQPGINLFLDVQVNNLNTCEPMKGVYVDFWHANSTGVYSDLVTQGTAGLTFLRGIQASDEYGLVQVLTKFPGYYEGRAQHIHVKVHVNGTVLPNNTFSGGSVVHTGQVFFEQSTLTQVNRIFPYSEDPNSLTLNSVDRVVQEQGNTSYADPFVEIRSLGYNISAGFIGFVNLAIDPDTVPLATGGYQESPNYPIPSGNEMPPSGSSPIVGPSSSVAS